MCVCVCHPVSCRALASEQLESETQPGHCWLNRTIVSKRFVALSSRLALYQTSLWACLLVFVTVKGEREGKERDRVEWKAKATTFGPPH